MTAPVNVAMSNSLADLAERIEQEHEASALAARPKHSRIVGRYAERRTRLD